jgi:hypothetical protein
MLLSRNRREGGARDNAIHGLLLAVFAENLVSGWIYEMNLLAGGAGPGLVGINGGILSRRPWVWSWASR